MHFVGIQPMKLVLLSPCPTGCTTGALLKEAHFCDKEQRRHLGKQFGIFLTQCESPQKDVTAQSDEASERKTQRHHLNIMPLSQEHNVPICPHIRLLPIHQSADTHRTAF